MAKLANAQDLKSCVLTDIMGSIPIIPTTFFGAIMITAKEAASGKLAIEHQLREIDYHISVAAQDMCYQICYTIDVKFLKFIPQIVKKLQKSGYEVILRERYNVAPIAIKDIKFDRPIVLHVSW